MMRYNRSRFLPAGFLGIALFLWMTGSAPATAADEGASSGDIPVDRVWITSVENELPGVPSAPGDDGGGGVTPPVTPPPGGGGGGGGGVTPPGPVVSDDGVLTVDAANTGTVRNITVLAGVTLDNSGGTLVGATNAGTIVGGTLSGVIANGGLISGTLILEEGAEIRGGTVTGTLSGNGTGAVLVQALVDGAVLSNIRIGPGCILTFTAVYLNPGLDLTGAVTSAGGVVDPAAELLQGPDGSRYSPANLMEGQMREVLPGINLSSQADAASGALTIFAGFPPSLMVPARIMRATAVSLSDGIILTPNGGLGFIRNGVFLEAVPWPLHMASFSGAMQDAGMVLEMDENGVATVRLPTGTVLSFRFDIIATWPEQSNPPSASPVFSISGNPELPEEFTLMITYPDGATQKMPPFLRDLGDFTGAAQDAGVSCRIDPSSGVIELLDAAGAVIYRGRPDYFLTGPNPGVPGRTFEPAGDVNGDGLEDIYMVTPSAKQVIYTIRMRHVPSVEEMRTAW